MEKRTERNSKLYLQINKEISDIKYVENNGEFKQTNDVLSNVNPELFAKNKISKKESKKKNGSMKKVFIGAAVVVAIVVLIIIIVAVINNGK